MALQEFLKTMGLNEKEQHVYIALLKLGDAAVARIGHEACEKRTTTYDVLKSLEEKGLVSSYRERGVKRFAAESPTKLRSVAEGQLAVIDKYLPELQSFYNSAQRWAAVHFFEGASGARQVSEDVLMLHDTTIYSMGSIQHMKEATAISVRFTKRRVKQKIFEKALRIRSEFGEDYIKRQQEDFKEMRFLPEGLAEIKTLTHIYGDKVAVIGPKEEGASFIIESKSFAETMRRIFEVVWGVSVKGNL